MADDHKIDGQAAPNGDEENAEISATEIEHGDAGVGGDGHDDQRVTLTEEDNKRIRRKTDRVILTILVWVYFLQILDKTILGYSAIFGLREDANLEGNQYSVVGSIAPIAQLAWQPFSSILIVKVPHRILMPVLVLGWGIAQACTPACRSFRSLLVDRFFLGLFEAGCLPLFSIITSQWYRRSEQPVRVAAWYGTNGLATIVAALLSYGLGSIKSPILAPWQIIFLCTGLVTIATAPFIYWKLDSDIPSARFLTKTERAQALERLRANQTGVGSQNLKWSQVLEAFLDVKTYLFIAMSLANNLGAQVTNTFGPLILSGLGFDKYKTTLLNIPFGAIQYVIILAVAWAAAKLRWKSITLLAILVPILAGLVLLYAMPRGEGGQAQNTPALLAGYYLLAFIFGCNTLIVAWILANTAGQTKKAAMMSLYNAASSAGNIIGPLLFTAADAPSYLPGLRSTLVVFIAMGVAILLQAANLRLLNRRQARLRVAHGKPARLHDRSMDHEYVAASEDEDSTRNGTGNQAFADLTDRENDEFIYVY
ncbi:major facilitator superfamily domain-containing protein [Lasiosphaeria miniovina]|uniref:Major facilitator superfamily domain-containing protein n=1 Tax=Lasiosphaeria miniovina TaxID=1954250 RepID=A0AA40AX53_9PEZI|nr:major facilitator superfamily domain-containing protein [Lasiosphaeria miniovina]KAK0723585.1 major facilitator superfamily domain-containing protein [Lasiosphaeria miniovina]